MGDLKGFSSIGEAMKAIRQAKGVSQEELIDKTLISFEFLANLEELRYSFLPSISYSLGLIENLLESLDVDRDQINILLEKAEKEFAAKNDKSILSDLSKKNKSLFSESTKEKKDGAIVSMGFRDFFGGSFIVFLCFCGGSWSLGGEKKGRTINKKR